MEDTKSLVTIFLQNIFHDRQYIIDKTYKLIYDYNNGERKKVDYEKTLRSICSQLGKEIPNQVLVYLLALVDMPLDLAESDDTQLKPVIEKIKTLEEIQKTQTCLADSIKPHLEEYVNSGKSSTRNGEKKKEYLESRDSKHQQDLNSIAESFELDDSAVTVTTVHSERDRQVMKTPRVKRKIIETNEEIKQVRVRKVRTLLDLAANSVVNNHKNLKKSYQKRFERAWKLIESDQHSGESLRKCYDTLRDLNKKRKLLRDIENDNITEEVVGELYQDTDIFLKEKHIFEALKMDIFQLVNETFVNIK